MLRLAPYAWVGNQRMQVVPDGDNIGWVDMMSPQSSLFFQPLVRLAQVNMNRLGQARFGYTGFRLGKASLVRQARFGRLGQASQFTLGQDRQVRLDRFDQTGQTRQVKLDRLDQTDQTRQVRLDRLDQAGWTRQVRLGRLDQTRQTRQVG